MSHRHDASWISEAYVFGSGGLGVLAENIPSTGDSGGAFLYPAVALPADNGKEICGRITTWPTGGTLVAEENGAFTYTPSGSGPDFFEYQLIVDGATSTTNIGYGAGIGHVSLQVGSVSAKIAALTANTVFSGNAHQIVKAFFSAATANAVFSGGAHPVSASSFALTTAEATFSGNAHPSGVIAAVFSPTTASAVFSGGAKVSPKTSISVALSDAVFSGGASAGVCIAHITGIARRGANASAALSYSAAAAGHGSFFGRTQGAGAVAYLPAITVASRFGHDNPTMAFSAIVVTRQQRVYAIQ